MVPGNIVLPEEFLEILKSNSYVFEQLFTPVYHPNLFLLYTNDILLNEEAKIAAFADDNAILSMKLQKLLIA